MCHVNFLMKDALKKLKKLRGRTLDEARVRGAQALLARAERFGFGARLPSDAELARLVQNAPHGPEKVDAQALLEHFRRAPRTFFAAFDDAGATRAELKRRFAQDENSTLLKRAARIREGRFDLLGMSDLSFGDTIDWNFEPVAQKRAPMTHWSSIGELDAQAAGDKKIIWELNRHQHFFTLGRAYWHTGDEQHAQVFAAHLSSWMDQHTPKRGVNWMSSLEVAFRSISWLWALHFFKDSVHLTPELYARSLKYLYLQGRHLEMYLSTYFSPNTHLTGEALGLFYLGVCLPELRRAARWREVGKRVLVEQLARHVRADGVYFEQASYYHRYTADFYTHFLLLARAAGEAVDEQVAPQLLSICDHLMHLTAPDGTTPFYGDDDGGRLAPLDERAAADFRATLSTAAAIFARADYKYVASHPSEETLWLAGHKSLAAVDALEAHAPVETSRAFPDGGFYVMRDAWTRDANYFLIDCGPHGAEGGGHAHADALSFALAARGRTLLVDPGTYSYTGSREMRDYFRSTAAHNALVIDGTSSSVPDGPFSWATSARCEPREWLTRTRFDFFDGEHDGYRRLPDPVTHRRSVLFLKNDYFILRDEAKADARHRFELYFHLAPDAQPRVEGEGKNSFISARPESDSGIELHTNGGAHGRWRIEDGWVSPCYGARVAAQICVFESESEGAQEFVTVAVPRAANTQTPARVLSLMPGRASHFLEIVDAGVRDFVILNRPGNLVSEQRFTTDFAWTWVRLAEDDALQELILIGGGTRFDYEGRRVLSAPAALRFASARVVEGELHFESEASEGGAKSTNLPANSDVFMIDGRAFGLHDKLSKEGRGPVETAAI